MWGIVLVISTMPHFITTHSINNPNYIKMQQNKNQQLDAKFRKFIKVLIMRFIDKDVVDAHALEVRHVVLAGLPLICALLTSAPCW